MRGELSPLDRLTVADRATNRLRDHVLSGAVTPGSRLTELGLAERLGIGRASVRTALNRLAFEGIVVKIPYTGWQIAQLSAEAAWEIWTLRGSLESLAARILAQDMDEARAEALLSAHDHFRHACASGLTENISAADFAFHKLTIELTGHRRLKEQYHLVEGQVRLFISTSNTRSAVTGQDALSQHDRLVAALLAGDPEAAAREAWQHSDSAGHRLAERLAAEAAAAR